MPRLSSTVIPLIPLGLAALFYTSDQPVSVKIIFNDPTQRQETQHLPISYEQATPWIDYGPPLPNVQHQQTRRSNSVAQKPYTKTDESTSEIKTLHLKLLVKCLDDNVGTMRFNNDTAIIVPKTFEGVPCTVTENGLEQYTSLNIPPKESVESKTLEVRMLTWGKYVSFTKDQKEKEDGLVCLNKYTHTSSGLPSQSLDLRLRKGLKEALTKMGGAVESSIDTILSQPPKPEPTSQKTDTQPYTATSDSRLVIIPWTHDWINYDRRFGWKDVSVTRINPPRIKGNDPKDYRVLATSRPKTYILAPSIDLLELCYCGQPDEDARDTYSDKVLSDTPTTQQDFVSQQLAKLDDNGCQSKPEQYQQFPLFTVLCDSKDGK